MDYKVVDAVRIAVGTFERRKSSPWRFWGNKKGDVYASARSMGDIFKISLHADGKCFAGFTSEYKSKHPDSLLNRPRHFDKWELNINSSEVAIQVLFPESELRVYRPKNMDKVTWLDPPDRNHMFVISVYILPHSIKEALFGLGNKMFPIASFETTTRNAVIVGHYQELDLATNTWIEEQKKYFFDNYHISKKDGYRAIVGGYEITKKRRWFLDVAWQD